MYLLLAPQAHTMSHMMERGLYSWHRRNVSRRHLRRRLALLRLLQLVLWLLNVAWLIVKWTCIILWRIACWLYRLARPRVAAKLAQHWPRLTQRAESLQIATRPEHVHADSKQCDICCWWSPDVKLRYDDHNWGETLCDVCAAKGDPMMLLALVTRYDSIAVG